MMRFEETVWRVCVLIVDIRALKLGFIAKSGELARNWRSSEFEEFEMNEEILMILIKKMSRLASPSYTFAEVVLYPSFEDSRDISRLEPMPVFCCDEAMNRSG